MPFNQKRIPLSNALPPTTLYLVGDPITLAPFSDLEVSVNHHWCDPLAHATPSGYTADREINEFRSHLAVKPALVQVKSGHTKIQITNFGPNAIWISENQPIGELLPAKLEKAESPDWPAVFSVYDTGNIDSLFTEDSDFDTDNDDDPPDFCIDSDSDLSETDSEIHFPHALRDWHEDSPSSQEDSTPTPSHAGHGCYPHQIPRSPRSPLQELPPQNLTPSENPLNIHSPNELNAQSSLPPPEKNLETNQADAYEDPTLKVKINPKLSIQQQNELRTLLKKVSHLFVDDIRDLTPSFVAPFDIDTGLEKPVNVPPRRVPPTELRLKNN
jgi:hypothetical protein